MKHQQIPSTIPKPKVGVVVGKPLINPNSLHRLGVISIRLSTTLGNTIHFTALYYIYG
ncbi:hypothetical protein HYC85_007785 [Camellia sinensis]|uniref:Uncharacterized protein n=1 Tax=Camellia sinensis TaxID=4442 RepID=A0A7J7HQL1_CAMSI|nr:hypothetical protein HYC85_007785 [Camellia sinensis]